jgi:CheY-like chemotaxis protein
MNLAVNARDAMPKGGKIILETANVELDESFSSDPRKPGAVPYVLLAVSDTGMGMDAETQARIFEPFFTTKELSKGTGLGLSSVYGMVNQSGGHIRVYSELGHGTAFKIYLPRVDEEAQQTARPHGGDRSYQGTETVLLVEDEESLRTLTRQFLEQSGYGVIEAANGSHALEVVQEHRGPIHLLLSDVVMPGISGPALAATLAPLHPETKVLYVSGYTGGFAVHNGLLDARMRLLQKPFSRDGLLQKVREALDAKT